MPCTPAQWLEASSPSRSLSGGEAPASPPWEHLAVEVPGARRVDAVVGPCGPHGSGDAVGIETEGCQNRIGLAMAEEGAGHAQGEEFWRRDPLCARRSGDAIGQMRSRAAEANSIFNGDDEVASSQIGQHLGICGNDDPRVVHGGVDTVGVEEYRGVRDRFEHLADANNGY